MTRSLHWVHAGRQACAYNFRRIYGIGQGGMSFFVVVHGIYPCTSGFFNSQIHSPRWRLLAQWELGWEYKHLWGDFSSSLGVVGRRGFLAIEASAAYYSTHALSKWNLHLSSAYNKSMDGSQFMKPCSSQGTFKSIMLTSYLFLLTPKRMRCVTWSLPPNSSNSDRVTVKCDGNTHHQVV